MPNSYMSFLEYPIWLCFSWNIFDISALGDQGGPRGGVQEALRKNIYPVSCLKSRDPLGRWGPPDRRSHTHKGRWPYIFAASVALLPCLMVWLTSLKCHFQFAAAGRYVVFLSSGVLARA